MDYSLFDKYEMKTAFIPALMILLPVLLALLTYFQVDNFPLKNTIVWNLVFFITLLFAISMGVRYFGQKKGMIIRKWKIKAWIREEWKNKEWREKKWKKWIIGEWRKKEWRELIPLSSPTTEFLRGRNRKVFDIATKEKISEKCEAKFGIKLKFDGSVIAQDRQNAKVFELIQDYLYKEDPEGLWHKQQTLFHHARNINGSRNVFAVIALLSLLASGAYVFIEQQKFPYIFIINAVYILFVFLYIWKVIPYSMRRYAEDYAEEAITTFLISSPDSAPSQASHTI